MGCYTGLTCFAWLDWGCNASDFWFVSLVLVICLGFWVLILGSGFSGFSRCCLLGLAFLVLFGFMSFGFRICSIYCGFEFDDLHGWNNTGFRNFV